MTPQDRQHRKVAILKFVRENIPVLPATSRDLYPQARQCKDLGLYSQTTFIGDVANRLWWLRKEMPAKEQEQAKRIALAAPDLLAACKEAERLLGTMSMVCHPSAAPDQETALQAFGVLRSAIAKAEGGAG